MFLALFGIDTIEWLCGELNGTARVRKHKYAMLWEPPDVRRILAFFVRALANGTPDLDNHMRSDRPGEISANRLAGFRFLLKYDMPELFRMVSANYRRQIQAGGTACLDETIWPWTGNHYAVVYIPRKPNTTGLKAITLCVTMTRSNRSYCIDIVPDISEPQLDPAACLDMAVQTMQSLGLQSLIADAWFGSLNALHRHTDVFISFSIGGTRGAAIFPVFHHNLNWRDYRLFRKEGVILSVYADNAILSVASTLYEVTTLVRSENPIVSGARLATAPTLAQLSNLPPRFSPQFRDLLLAAQNLPKSDIMVLATYVGEAKGTARRG